MIRARFFLNTAEVMGDYRPVKWPVKHPYWCSGETDKEFNMVAFADDVYEIIENWPEAYTIECTDVNGVYFTDRFPKPDWYNE